MKCVICKNGQTEPGSTTVTLTRDETTVVFKQVPADVCENCGESYVDSDVTEKLLSVAENTANNGVEVDIRTFKAA